jgi:hypothetical protein
MLCDDGPRLVVLLVFGFVIGALASRQSVGALFYAGFFFLILFVGFEGGDRLRPPPRGSDMGPFWSDLPYFVVSFGIPIAIVSLFLSAALDAPVQVIQKARALRRQALRRVFLSVLALICLVPTSLAVASYLDRREYAAGAEAFTRFHPARDYPIGHVIHLGHADGRAVEAVVVLVNGKSAWVRRFTHGEPYDPSVHGPLAPTP